MEDRTLNDIRSNIKEYLLEGAVEKVLDALLKDAIGDELKSMIDSYNEKHSDYAIKYNGITADELLKSIAVDKKYNVIIHDGTFAGKISYYLNQHKISMSKKNIQLKLVKVRDIRNFCSHKNEGTVFKNAVQGAEKLAALRDFMNNFKILYKDICDDYGREEAIIIDKLAEYAKVHNENVEQFNEVFMHSGMIEMDAFAEELCGSDLEGKEKSAVEKLVYAAVLEQNIIHSGLRFAKSQTDIVRRHILLNAERLELTKEEKENLQETIEEISNEIKRQWIFENGFALDVQEILSLVNENNILLDYRYLLDSGYLGFIENKIIPLLDRDTKLFMTPVLNDFNRNNYGKGNDVYDRFIDTYGTKITLFSEENDDEAENLKNIVEGRSQYNFMVITKDETLSSHFKEEPFNGTVMVLGEEAAAPVINVNEAVNVNPVNNANEVTYVEPVEVAYIETRRTEENNSQSQNSVMNNSNGPLFVKKTIDPYLEDEKLTVSSAIEENSIVIDRQGNPIKILERIGEGGEGAVYRCSNENLVAKIYYQNNTTKNRKEKLELMSSKQISAPGICWPVDTLYNGNGEFVGYLMPKVSGVDFDRMVSNTGKPMERRGWDRKNVVTCLINIMQMFDYLHKNNIVVGDINGANIMIESYDKVFLVDTDSFQLDKYPCQVEKQIYVDPTLKITEGEKQAYTIKEDRYKLAIIAYLMLMPGQMPYPINEGGAGGVFRFTEKGAKITAKPVYNYIWSNMEKSVKKLFLRVFDNDERNVSAEDWIRALNRYLQDIGDDSERNKIRIEGYRGNNFEEDVKCSRCGGRLNLTKDVAKERIERFGTDKILCRDCSISDGLDRNKSIYMKCPGCSRLLTVSESYIESKRANGIVRITCNDCGNGKGARPLYEIPRLSDVMLEMGD